MAIRRLLTEKRILVTGGARGLGKAIVTEVAREGARVAFTYAKSTDAAASLVQEIAHSFDVACLSFKVSALDFEASSRMGRELIGKWGGIDVLINNAGISHFLPLALMDEEDWDTVLDTNLKGIFITCKAILPTMVKARSGAVLNIGSLAGARILAAPIHYCASKAGVIGFTEALAKEVGRYNIRINCLAPGILEGGVADGIPENKIDDYLQQVSLHRLGTCQEVAKCAAFLVSDRNSYMTGNTVIIDGGL